MKENECHLCENLKLEKRVKGIGKVKLLKSGRKGRGPNRGP